MEERGTHGLLVLSLRTPGAALLSMITGESWHAVGFYFQQDTTSTEDENYDVTLIRTRASPISLERKLTEGGWGLNVRRLFTLLPIHTIGFYPFKGESPSAQDLRIAVTLALSRHISPPPSDYTPLMLESLGMNPKHKDGFALVSRIFHSLNGSRISPYEVLRSDLLASPIWKNPPPPSTLHDPEMETLSSSFQKLVTQDSTHDLLWKNTCNHSNESHLVRQAYEALDAFGRSSQTGHTSQVGHLEIGPLYNLVEHLSHRYSLPPPVRPSAGTWCVSVERTEEPSKPSPVPITMYGGDLRNLSTVTLRKLLEVLDQSTSEESRVIQNKIIHELALRE